MYRKCCGSAVSFVEPEVGNTDGPGVFRLKECCGHRFPGLRFPRPSWRSSTDTLVLCVRTVLLSLQILLLLLYKKERDTLQQQWLCGSNWGAVPGMSKRNAKTPNKGTTSSKKSNSSWLCAIRKLKVYLLELLPTSLNDVANVVFDYRLQYDFEYIPRKVCQGLHCL